jgi:putative membrane protein
MMILIGKTVTLFFWGAVLLSLFSVFPSNVVTFLGWSGVVILFIHFIEVAIFTRRFGARLVDPKYEKSMVLVFGVFHVLPFMMKEVESKKVKSEK